MIRHRSLRSLGIMLLLASTAYASGQMMSIQIKSGKLRSAPSFLGQVVASAAYGSRVEIIQQSGSWAQVRDERGVTGWIHQSALSPKKIVLRAGDGDVVAGATSEDLALAGKGFNSEVEAEFKAQNPEIDFKWVDWMLTQVVTPEESAAFLAAGQVQPSEGGER